jgi:hypothetical protein
MCRRQPSGQKSPSSRPKDGLPRLLLHHGTRYCPDTRSCSVACRLHAMTAHRTCDTAAPLRRCQLHTVTKLALEAAPVSNQQCSSNCFMLHCCSLHCSLHMPTRARAARLSTHSDKPDHTRIRIRNTDTEYGTSPKIPGTVHVRIRNTDTEYGTSAKIQVRIWNTDTEYGIRTQPQNTDTEYGYRIRTHNFGT